MILQTGCIDGYLLYYQGFAGALPRSEKGSFHRDMMLATMKWSPATASGIIEGSSVLWAACFGGKRPSSLRTSKKRHVCGS